MVESAVSFPPVQRVLGLSPHGLFVALGFLAGARLLLAELRRRDADIDAAVRALTWTAVCAVLGARLDYVLFHFSDFFGDGQSVGSGVLSALRVWEGGLALFGGLIGGFAGGLPVAHRAGFHLPRVLDAVAPGIALGVAVGRVGDLVIADHLGRVASGWARPLAFLVQPGYDLAPGFGPSPAVPGPCTNSGQFFAGCHYHLAAGYDLVGAAVLFVVLVLLRRRRRSRAGVAFLLWGAWYGAQRFVIDFTRSPLDAELPFHLTDTQVLGLALSLVCSATLVRIAVRRRGLGERPGDPPSELASLHRSAPEPVAPADPDPGQDSPTPDSEASSTPSANPLA